ncbi:MAG: UDP-N-acetylmuramate: L-alanyl-gamma-D-glutamyl-meso-diaminopimelate ligase [Sphingobacteriales bacterium]|jgi:UDP-N-acetylmuramate: L-alanyl-gamma-D-glutamyl-meso-diaminopimelate ligase
MNIHFIAIGGNVMHNLAIALHKKGFNITGSDDEFFDPSKGRLESYGLLPEKNGWDPQRITKDLDGVILGMHARIDNPELQKAQELGIPIYSFPEYIYEQSKDKKRVVIAGSHGKTSVTAMVMHVLKGMEMDFDYMVGAQLDGFETMVKLTDAPVIILEGDEYLSSPLDRKPKFLHYKAHIAVLNGIAWDHINVFPTYKEYFNQFELFLQSMEEEGCCFYYEGDPENVRLAQKHRGNVALKSFELPNHKVENGVTTIFNKDKEVAIKVFGKHNLQNLSAAQSICEALGISIDDFLNSISSFSGAAKRLEVLVNGKDRGFFKDYAHSPSKLEATVKAVKNQFPSRKLFACMELHTFSSLNKEFLSQYAGSMADADVPVVFYNAHTLAHKKMPPLSPILVKEAFERDDILVIDSEKALNEYVFSQNYANSNLLLMSSGNFGGLDLKTLAETVQK